METISLGELRIKYHEVYEAVMAKESFGTPDIAPSRFTVVHDPEEAGRVLITSSQVHNFPVYQHPRTESSESSRKQKILDVTKELQEIKEKHDLLDVSCTVRHGSSDVTVAVDEDGIHLVLWPQEESS